MIDSVIYEIGKLKWLIVIDFSIIIFCCALLIFFTRKFSWNRKKVKLFSILYNLDEKKAACVGLLIGRICFVISSIAYPYEIGWGYLIVLLLFDIAILVLTMKPKLFAVDTLSFAIIFFLLYINSSLWNFYNNVNNEFVILLMIINVSIFIVFFSVLQTLKCYEGITGNREKPIKIKKNRKEGQEINA